MTSLRKTISRQMVNAWTSIPHVTQFDEFDIQDLMELRKKHAAQYEEQGAHLTLTSFILKAVVRVLQKHPIFNASIDEATHEVVFKEYYHLGIAVDTEQGLIVPVIRDVDQKSLLGISKDLADIAERTRKRKVSLEEMQGASFTISNQGGIGGGHFTPIINKPEVAILGIGRGIKKPVVVGKEIETHVMMPVTLSYDHRIIDGGQAARFIVELSEVFHQFTEVDLELSKKSKKASGKGKK